MHDNNQHNSDKTLTDAGPLRCGNRRADVVDKAYKVGTRDERRETFYQNLNKPQAPIRLKHVCQYIMIRFFEKL